MNDGRWQYLPHAPRRHFTVVEAVIAFSLVAIALRVALPFAVDFARERKASGVLQSVLSVENAVRQAAKGGDMAALIDAPPGVVPPGLEAYLPAGFSFDQNDFVLNWNLFDGTEVLERVLVGTHHGSINVEIENDGLHAAVARLAGRRIWLDREHVLSVLVVDLDRQR